jgi:hypothetical protein
LLLCNSLTPRRSRCKEVAAGVKQFHLDGRAPAMGSGYSVPSSVEGFSAIAERRRRVRRTKSASKPARMRSPADRLGDRCRERFTMRSWCFRRSDSATRERTPPGPSNRASVARFCASLSGHTTCDICYELILRADQPILHPSTTTIHCYGVRGYKMGQSGIGPVR